MEKQSNSIEEANTSVGLLNLLVNLEILGKVTEQLAISKQTKEITFRELEMRKVQASNDLQFYEAALAKLDELIKRP